MKVHIVIDIDASGAKLEQEMILEQIEALLCNGHAVFTWEDELVPGVDYEPAVCDNCGQDAHTAEEMQACVNSMLAPQQEEEE